jgi:hypothetical protein
LRNHSVGHRTGSVLRIPRSLAAKALPTREETRPRRAVLVR